MTYFFSKTFPDIRAKPRCLERGPLTPQIEVLVLAIRAYPFLLSGSCSIPLLGKWEPVFPSFSHLLDLRLTSHPPPPSPSSNTVLHNVSLARLPRYIPEYGTPQNPSIAKHYSSLIV